MSDPIITLTTDFGEASPYVAAMKGVILATNPSARIVDLTHRIPPQDVYFADFYLAAAVPAFAPGVIHVVVVDPGVGSDRKLLYVDIGGQRLLAPDNGCWTSLAQVIDKKPSVRCLTEERYWRQPVSATFHGRDILAPVAGYLSLGEAPSLMGPALEEWVRLEPAVPHVNEQTGEAIGQVVFVDEFGNLITNLPAGLVTAGKDGRAAKIAGRQVDRWVRTYSDAGPGDLVGLVSSFGTLEVALVRGNAALRLGARIGTRVEVVGNQAAPVGEQEPQASQEPGVRQ